MSDETVHPDVPASAAQAVGPGPGSGSERTGVPVVDRVLASVEGVTALPVAERVAVFERAHDELRRALDADPTSDLVGR